MARSPLITADSWGRVEVDGVTYKDVKLWPGGARAWDWAESGTSHESVDSRDIAELVSHGARIVLVSTGRTGRIRALPELARELGDDVQVEILETGQAIDRYNELANDGSPVGALIHTTC